MVVRAADFSFGAWLGFLLILGPPVHAAEELEGTNLWNFSLKAPMVSDMVSDIASSTPAVAPDGTIYVGTFNGVLYALSPDGRPRWHFRAGSQIQSSPAIADDGTIYFGSRDRQFYAVTPQGELKWKFATGAWVDSSPAIAADGTVYVGSWDRDFYALKPDGSLKWKFATGGILDSSPAIAADGTIYFGAHNKKFYALNPDGQPVWTFATGAEITSSPAIGEDGSVYFSSTDGNLYRLKSDGKEIWHCHTGGGGSGSPVLADNGNVIIAAVQTTLFISPAGAIVERAYGSCWIDETPAAAQGAVCFSSPWVHLRACDPEGRPLWSVLTSANLTSSPVIGNNGIVYCCCGDRVEAVQPPLALFPSRSSWPMFRANARHTGRVGGSR